MTFEQQLSYGKMGESNIATWLRNRGYAVLPVYDLEINNGKGPALYMPNKELIAPDMFIFKGTKCFWIEAKHKTAFTWHRISNRWVTGIDLRHYRDYCEVDDTTPFPVWLMFLHDGGQAKDSPPNSPRGLFGNSLVNLRNHENHRYSRYGNSGMVYWWIGDLVKLLG